MTNKLNKILADWTRIGAAVNVRPAPRTPDLEQLLLDTAELIPHDPRLPTVAASWLAIYPLFVARHRLAALLTQSEGFTHHAELGLLLDTVRRQARTQHFNQVIDLCGPVRPPRPLFLVQQENAIWRKAAEGEASAISKHWGLWCQAIEHKDDVIRPASWIIFHNPLFYDRAILRGDLRLSILAALRANPSVGASELALTHVVGANRSAVRYALAALEQSCHIQRNLEGKRTVITLVEPRWLRAA